MAKKKDAEERIFKVRDFDIKDEMKKDFVTYAREVNAHRAFPYELPGIKPVAGHAFWSMFVNKRNSSRPYTKSAKVEGEVMSFSPHGGCLTSDTKMFLLSGEVKTLGELLEANKDEYVLSIDKDGNIIPALATNFRKTKDVTELYEIKFANGFSIKATGNHKFRLITDEWVSADSLHAGHILDYGKISKADKKYLTISGNKTHNIALHTFINKSDRHKEKCTQGLVRNGLINALKTTSIRHDFNYNYIKNLKCFEVAEYIPFIISVTKIECGVTPVYDFTVNGPENALISISDDNSLLACAHNSYSALARMAADYIYHIPYIDGHGSFGSAVGGPTPGAARYTEMRLSEFTEDVLLYNTKLLDMGLNYLEEEPEPKLEKWVALLPLLFMTNTSGMGYTASNTWSSGNLREFAEQLHNYIDNGVVDCSKVYPDFPTGGVIVNKSDLKTLYETGQGTIKLRGKVEVDGDIIRITSLPYNTYPEQFIEDVKKYVAGNANTIKDLSNMSGMKGFLIEIECEEGTAEYTLDCLFKKTCLQINISDEHKAIDSSGKPVLIPLEKYIKDFIEGNIEMVVKEAALNLSDISKRLEIVNGLINALDVIDEIIAIIKKSKSIEESKKAISNKFGFTEIQSAAIVGTTLGKLANLEQIKLQDEKKELEKKKKENDKLINSRKDQIKFFLDRFDKLVEKYGWDRKTEVTDAVIEEVTTTRIAKPTQLKPKKEFMIVLTSENCLKRVDVVKFRQTDEDSKTIKVAGNQKVTMVSNKGMMYKVWSNNLDKCLATASGTPIESLIQLAAPDEKIFAIYSEDIDIPNVFIVTKNGLGKMCTFKDTLGLSKTVGTIICRFKSEDDEVIALKLIHENEKIEITTSMDRKEIVTPDKIQGRGAAGKKVINLKKDEEITEVHSI